MKKLGFTLTEMLIALTIIGIISAITAPTLRGMMPNQNKIMIKRAYNITANVVKDLIDNTTLFSPFDADGTVVLYKGFDNTNAVVHNGKTYSGSTKFPDLFLDSIGATNSTTTTCTVNFKSKRTTINTSYSCTSAITKNGITWFVMNPAIIDVAAFITVDVNGNKKPNCSQTDSSCSNKTSGFDRFTIQVMNDGEVLLNEKDTWAKSSININSNLNSD